MFTKFAFTCLALPSFLGATGIVEEKSSLEQTVEDVETLRVLVTNSLRASAGGSWVEWTRDADGALKSYFRTDGANDDSAESKRDDDEDDGEDDASDADGDRTASAVRTRWLAAVANQVYANGLKSHFLADGEAATAYTRAFYAPGVGAWIDTNLKVPYTFVSDSDPKDSTRAAADDDWAAAKRSLASEAGGDATDQGESAKVLSLALDSKRIEAAVEGVITVLREHGHRIRGLADEESVVVALKIEGSGFGVRDDSSVRYLEGWAGSNFVLRGGVGYRTAKQPQTRTVIVRAPKSLLAAAASGDLDAAAFAKRLSITRY